VTAEVGQGKDLRVCPFLPQCNPFQVHSNEHIKKIMGVKGKSDIIDIIEKKRLQWYGHIKRMPEETIPKLIMEWIPEEKRKR
jgi:hypothetical protein